MKIKILTDFQTFISVHLKIHLMGLHERLHFRNFLNFLMEVSFRIWIHVRKYIREFRWSVSRDIYRFWGEIILLDYRDKMHLEWGIVWLKLGGKILILTRAYHIFTKAAEEDKWPPYHPKHCVFSSFYLLLFPLKDFIFLIHATADMFNCMFLSCHVRVSEWFSESKNSSIIWPVWLNGECSFTN